MPEQQTFVVIFLMISMLLCSKVAAQTEGELRMMGGDFNNEGNLMIYHDGEWGLICDDMWDIRDARVACVQMGFKLGASRGTRKNRFNDLKYLGKELNKIWLDNTHCKGFEKNISNCRHLAWGVNNCAIKEAAGVICKSNGRPVRIKTTTTTTTTTQAPTTTKPPLFRSQVLQFGASNASKDNKPQKDEKLTKTDGIKTGETLIKTVEQVKRYPIRIKGGRNPTEGRLEIYVGKRWGVICGSKWGMFEAMIACKQLGMGYAKYPTKMNFFGGETKDKIFGQLQCNGKENNIYECIHHEFLQDEGDDVKCQRPEHVAGVMCTKHLPDLAINITMLAEHLRLEDLTLEQLSCAMEENCASASAYEIKRTSSNWQWSYRRLLRFSSNIHNNGTAPFEPFEPRERWEWHQCHMHFHSMAVFSHYDILDDHGNRMAQGHKASFCLEDVHCYNGQTKYYSCEGNLQGISVGCSDIYLHDIDCQWIDVTDLKPNNYKFRIHINPEYKVAELSYENNVATCDLYFTGYSVSLSNCYLSGGQTLL